MHVFRDRLGLRGRPFQIPRAGTPEYAAFLARLEAHRAQMEERRAERLRNPTPPEPPVPNTIVPAKYACSYRRCPDGIASNEICAALTIYCTIQHFSRSATESPAGAISKRQNSCFTSAAFRRRTRN